MRSFYLFLIFITLVSSLNAEIINVPNDYSTIQSAINNSNHGDTILVSPGTYYENIRFNGKNVMLASHFILNNDISFIESTIINGGNPNHPDTASCVIFIHGEDSTAVLAGFTLTGGKGTRWEDEHYLNHWYTEGGGILIQYASPTIRNNIIKHNEAINNSTGITSAGGGAIRAGDSNPHILNNLILYNKGRYGAGIVLNFSGAIIKNNIIAYNYGGEDYGGGGIWCLGNGTRPKILENNNIVYNESATMGGGIRIWSSSVTITNCIFWGNSASTSPQIHGNGGNVSYSNIEGGMSGQGNINDEPMFESTNYVLSINSPCIDQGNPDPDYFDPEDPQNPGYALFPSRGGLSNDMGVYGGQGCSHLPGLILKVNEMDKRKENDIEVNIYPNPSVGSDISLIIRNAYNTKLIIQILDVNGCLLETVEINPWSNYIKSSIKNKLCTGLYFIVVKDEYRIITCKKLIIT